MLYTSSITSRCEQINPPYFLPWALPAEIRAVRLPRFRRRFSDPESVILSFAVHHGGVRTSRSRILKEKLAQAMENEKRRIREVESPKEDAGAAPKVVKRRNLGRVDAGDDELILEGGADSDDITNQTTEGIDDVVVLNLESVATRPVEEQNSDGRNESEMGDEHGNDEDGYSDVEIISSRQTPEVVASVDRTTTAPYQRNQAVERDPQDPDVSVELVEDWYGPEEARGRVQSGSNNNHHHAEVDVNAGYDDVTEESDDDLVMLDGKPTLSTDQLLNQIKEKDGHSSSVGPAATSAKTFQDVTCVICMDPIADAVAAACGHVFCASCIYRALASSREPGHGGTGPGGRRGKCPMCRKVVAYKNLVWLKVRYTKQDPDPNPVQ